jgi:hypothetical protein
MIRHFFIFYIPKDVDEGIALLHSHRGGGIKTLFYNIFKDHVKQLNQCSFMMNPLSYDKAMTKWAEAVAKEIRLIGFKGYSDPADQLKSLGHKEQIMILKPPRRSGMGKLKDYMDKNSDRAKAIEVLVPQCEAVKTIVDLNGAKRTFTIGDPSSNKVCEIEVPEDKWASDGNLDYNKSKDWCIEIIQEFTDSIYPKLGIKV